MIGVIAQKPATLPTPSNNKWIAAGDSRTAFSTENANLAFDTRITSRGYPQWAQQASGYRGEFVGNYGINTDTIQGNNTRLRGAGISGGTNVSTDPRRGWVLDADPGASAGTFVYLVGVNNTNAAAATTGGYYDTLFTAVIDAGKVLVICNELPNSNQSGQGAINYARRVYLDTWPFSSATLTAGQKTTYAAKTVHVNAYDTNADPASLYYPATGMFLDTLHPGPLGGRAIGEAVGAVLTQLFKSYPVRNIPISANAQSVLGVWDMAGTTGTITAETNLDGNGGAGIVGSLATGWSFGRSSTLKTLLNGTQGVNGKLSITLSKGLDSDGFATQIVRCVGPGVGTVGTNYSVGLSKQEFFSAANLASMNGGNSLADGDTLRASCRYAVSANPKGCNGVELALTASSAAYPQTPSACVAFGSGISYGPWTTMRAFVDHVLTPARTLPAGFVGTVETKTFTRIVNIYIASGVPIDFTVEISRFGVVKNV